MRHSEYLDEALRRIKTGVTIKYDRKWPGYLFVVVNGFTHLVFRDNKSAYEAYLALTAL